MMKPTSSRVYLVLLHVMFLVLFGFHLAWPLTRLQGGLIIALSVLTLLVLTVPRTQLSTAWFLGLLTLGNASILFATTMMEMVSAGPWILCALMLLLAMASYVTCLFHFALLNGLVIGSYAWLLHHMSLLQTENVLLLPALLCLTLVFLSKISLTQAEIRRLTETEEYTAANPCAMRSRDCRIARNFWTVSVGPCSVSSKIAICTLRSCLSTWMGSSRSMTGWDIKPATPCSDRRHECFTGV
jgi:hypothetical protein